MNKVLVTSGILIVLFARQLLSDEGARAAAIFLGGSMCVSVLFRIVMPIFDRLVGDSCRAHYLRLHEEYVKAQEVRIKKMEEEIYKNRKRNDATHP